MFNLNVPTNVEKEKDNLGGRTILDSGLYKAVITNIPDNKSLILNLTCIIPVNNPAKAPPKVARIKHKTGLTPFKSPAPTMAAPKGNEPSTDKSGKSSILYEI